MHESIGRLVDELIALVAAEKKLADDLESVAECQSASRHTGLALGYNYACVRLQRIMEIN